jgi:hypothetical protein
MKKKFVIGLIAFTVFIFSYGVFVGTYKVFPYEIFDTTKKIVLSEKDEMDGSDLETTIYETDVKSLIHINDENDIIKKRSDLVHYIWKGKGLPSSTPSEVMSGISDSNFNDLTNLKRIDKFTITMEYGVDSIAYLFLADKSNNSLIIYNHGHDKGFNDGKNTIQFFLEKGYSVLAFSMPLKGMNSQPVIDLQDFGRVKFTSHDMFVFLESSEFSPIKYFVEPIFVSLNYIDENFAFDSYYMTGISGGGWTTILYAAIDPRIVQSYSVAGSVPIYLRFIPKNLGDYEQISPDLYRIVDYLDLYILGSYGDNRKLVQIFNKFDSCCFSGELYKTYENEVKAKVSQLHKGSFDIYLDDTHRGHKISEHALNLILDSMRS